MRDMEDRLRDVLRDERWSLPVSAGAVDAIEAGAGRVRRRRRTGLVAGTVGVVLATTLGVSALRTGSSQVDPATPRHTARLEVVKRLGQGTSHPVLFHGSIYLNTDTGKVLRVSPATGQTLTTRDLHPDQGFRKDTITEPGSPVVSGGHLWAVTHTGLLRLNPVTLQVTKTVAFPALPAVPGHPQPPGTISTPAPTPAASAIAVSPAAIWIGNGGTTVFRLDGATGAVTTELTVTGDLPTPYDEINLISADDKTGVIWMTADHDTTAVTLLAAKVTKDHLEVIGSMSIQRSPWGYAATPGPDGSLWIAGKSVAHYTPQAAGRRLRSLPINGFPVTQWLAEHDGQLASTSNGTRLWIAMPNTSTGGTLLCLNGSTGAVLEPYPLTTSKDMGTGTPLPEAGDTHQVLIQPGGQLLKLHGPDHCLT